MAWKLRELRAAQGAAVTRDEPSRARNARTTFLVTVLLLGALAVVVFVACVLLFMFGGAPLVFGRGTIANDVEARQNVEIMAMAVNWYRLDHQGTIPPSLFALAPGYLERVPATDPWGGPYVLFGTPVKWEVRSAGPDGAMGTLDDIVSKPQ